MLFIKQCHFVFKVSMSIIADTHFFIDTSLVSVQKTSLTLATIFVIGKSFINIEPQN